MPLQREGVGNILERMPDRPGFGAILHQVTLTPAQVEQLRRTIVAGPSGAYTLVPPPVDAVESLAIVKHLQARVTELLEANNRLVDQVRTERRRAEAAEAGLAAAMDRLALLEAAAP